MHISIFLETSPCNEGISPQRPVYLIRMNFRTAWLTRIASRDERLVMGKPKRLSSQSSSGILGAEGVGSPSSLSVMKTQNGVPACWPFSGTRVSCCLLQWIPLHLWGRVQTFRTWPWLSTMAAEQASPCRPYSGHDGSHTQWTEVLQMQTLSFCSNKKVILAYSPCWSIVLLNPFWKRF